jgi:hypothetical protein
MEDGFDLDLDFNFTAAKYAWKLGTKIGSELGKLVDGDDKNDQGYTDDHSEITRHIDYGDLPDRYFDYGKF